jgi:opacity protein-like surface antigen
MKNSRRNSAISVVHLILTSFVLFAYLAFVGQGALAQGGRAITTPDNKYGEGGTKTTARDPLNRIIKEEWADKSGKVIERTETTYHADKEEKQNSDVVKTVKTWFYRVTSIGRVLRTATTKKIDRAGREKVETLEYDETGSKVIGKTVTTPEGVSRFTLNPATGKLEQVVSPAPATPPATTPVPPSAPVPEPAPSSEGEKTDEVMLVSYPQVELFGGYSYMREDSEPEGFNLNGWNASIAYNINRHVAVRADFSGYYKSEEDQFFSNSLRKHQFLFGLQGSIRPNERVRVFLRPLFGLAHVHTKTDIAGLTSPITFSDTAFAMALGGGLDINVSRRFFIRPFQLDYLFTHFGNSWQHNFRASSGIGFRFGTGSDEVEDDNADLGDPSVSSVPQMEAKKCNWERYILGKDTNVTSVKSDKPTIVEVRVTNLAGSGGFEYHCLKDRGTALITYKYTDANGGNQEGKLRVFCN